MKLSKQIFLENYKKPVKFIEAKTSMLMSDGLITYSPDKGIPFYLPIGRKILKNIQELLTIEAEKKDMSQIEVPYLVRDEILNSREGLTETFSKRVIKLDNSYFKGYHLRATPEPSILNLIGNSQLTHVQLPIKYVFNAESFMGVQHPKNILRGRQFNSFIGASLNADENSMEESILLYENFTKTILDKLNIPFLRKKKDGGRGSEVFYETPEGDNVSIPELSSERIKGMSLGMVYDYNSKNGKRVKFKDNNNNNQEVLYCTFGLGVQRVVYALMDSSRDEKGFDLKKMAPFDLSVIPANMSFSKEALETYEQLPGNIMLDDRKNKEWGKKADFSDYIGIPYKVIVDKDGYTLKDRSEKRINKFKNLESLANYIDNG